MIAPKPVLTAYNSREEWESALDKWLEAKTDEDEILQDEDTYDRFGNVSPCGIYDAGGHLIENWYDRIDEDAGKDR